MTVFVLDSSAVIRYHDDEAGADRVEAVFEACLHGIGEIQISALHWGEIAATLRKRYGPQEQEIKLRRLMQLDLRVMPISVERAVRAAAIRVDYRMALADAFAVELTLDTPDHVLVTADYDFKVAADLIEIELLPAK